MRKPLTPTFAVRGEQGRWFAVAPRDGMFDRRELHADDLATLQGDQATMKVAGSEESIGGDVRRRPAPRMNREGVGVQRAVCPSLELAPNPEHLRSQEKTRASHPWCSRGVSLVWYRLGRAEITGVSPG
jgi:hypothetical protein